MSVEDDDAGVWRAVARERARLADAMRDGALQELATARQDFAEALTGDGRAMTALGGDLERLAIELRALTGALHEQPLDELPLRQAIRQVTEPQRRRGRLRIDVDIDDAADGYRDPVVRETVRELVLNVEHHAAATSVTVTIDVDRNQLRLCVEDDGKGLDPEAAERARATGHLGLPRIERAAARLGGSLSIGPGPSSGTIAMVLLPTASLAYRRGARPDAPAHLSHVRDGQSSRAIIDAAEQRDRAASSSDLVSLARDRAADARDVTSARRESTDARRRRAHGTRSRAEGLHDRNSAARDREQAAVERLHAVADRLALAGQLSIAEMDALTGARTRSAGLADLDRELDRCRRTSGVLVAVYLDVVGLKAVNDTHGHAAGDDLLRRVVRTIRAYLRSYDIVVRLGGDEFLCVMPDMTLAEADRRLVAVASALAVPPPATVRVGYAVLAPDDTAGSLIQRADRDLLRRRDLLRPTDP